MKIRTLLAAGIRRQRGSIIGVGLLMLIVFLSVTLALTLSDNATAYVTDEMARVGFGNITAWVSGTELAPLAEDINRLADVGQAELQPLIFAGYRLNGTHSDDEGQLITHDAANYPYRFLSADGSAHVEVRDIAPGEIYLSPAMQSSYTVSIGDEIHFEMSRSGQEGVFTVAGWFENPFMGSSMIDMKSFLISQEDFDRLAQTIAETSDFYALAKMGAMLHITQVEGSDLSASDFARIVNESTALAEYTEFVHNESAMRGFMLILQNMLTGFLLAFAAVLWVVAMIVTGHSIMSSIEQEYKDIGILKTTGYTSGTLRLIQVLQYAAGILAGLILGWIVGGVLARMATSVMVSSNGLLIPSRVPLLLCLGAFLIICAVFAGFIVWKTRRIMLIAPMHAIREELSGGGAHTPITKRGLTWTLALRQVASGKRRYIGIVLIAVLLTFFVSVVGRMNAWLGPNGEGLMDAFSVADHSIGIQPTREMDMDEAEAVTAAFAPIVAKYDVAMQPVTVNGVDYTANALDQTDYFHILMDETCDDPDEIVVTEFVAHDLGLRIGDEVTIASGRQSETYRVVGIYQCANEMGANIGMSREGYARIANVNGFIWCHHYILEGCGYHENEALMAQLQQLYRLEADVHSNGWSGLDGIVSAMRMMTVLMLVIVALFILVVVALTSGRLLRSERRDMAILKSMGFSTGQLRLSFALRFVIVVLLGAAIGTVLAAIGADPLIARLVKLFGVGEFHSGLRLVGTVLPALSVTAVFAVFAYAFSRKVRKTVVSTIIPS